MYSLTNGKVSNKCKSNDQQKRKYKEDVAKITINIKTINENK